MNIRYLLSSIATVTVLGVFAFDDAVAQGTGCNSGVNCPRPPILCEIDGGPCDFGGGPYDLSRFNIPYPTIWPTPPTTNNSIAVDTCAEFQSAVRQSNVVINVAAGNYSSCNLSITGDDIDIVMSNFATLFGSVTMDLNTGGVVNRIRWTGGNINTGGSNTHQDWFVHDLLINDVHIDGLIRLVNASSTGNASARNAFVNTTIDGRSSGNAFTLLMQRAGAGGDFHTDLIFANSLLFNRNNTPIRSQKVDRMTVVESAFIQESSPLQTGFRFGENSHDAFMGGTSSKPTIVVGRIYMYTELLPGNYAIQNLTVDGLHRYWVSPNQVFNHGSHANTGTVSNLRHHATSGAGNPPGGIAPFSSGSGIDVVQSWDGSTLPDISSYGAQR